MVIIPMNRVIFKPKSIHYSILLKSALQVSTGELKINLHLRKLCICWDILMWFSPICFGVELVLLVHYNFQVGPHKRLGDLGGPHKKHVIHIFLWYGSKNLSGRILLRFTKLKLYVILSFLTMTFSKGSLSPPSPWVQVWKQCYEEN